ncbi:hypothetical protein [Halarsenatibacter silvermanii]|uniref:Uncharacterized protein n=1 Tax=Halarsenatibacter silvermanii TaxID=321763 RepID=A0A1G9RC34_9FIRM|nr:hypothetical protein [Halarsenatibacter silvermanii]SDM20784.1 hypothetical protein SAMN04488692_12133 [Halarsenatibacter silvermanii]
MSDGLIFYHTTEGHESPEENALLLEPGEIGTKTFMVRPFDRRSFFAITFVGELNADQWVEIGDYIVHINILELNHAELLMRIGRMTENFAFCTPLTEVGLATGTGTQSFLAENVDMFAGNEFKDSDMLFIHYYLMSTHSQQEGFVELQIGTTDAALQTPLIESEEKKEEGGSENNIAIKVESKGSAAHSFSDNLTIVSGLKVGGLDVLASGELLEINARAEILIILTLTENLMINGPQKTMKITRVGMSEPVRIRSPGYIGRDDIFSSTESILITVRSKISLTEIMDEARYSLTTEQVGNTVLLEWTVS